MRVRTSPMWILGVFAAFLTTIVLASGSPVSADEPAADKPKAAVEIEQPAGGHVRVFNRYKLSIREVNGASRRPPPWSTPGAT